MSPYVVPDHALRRIQQTPSTLIPRFGATLSIVSFDALGSGQTTGFPDDVSMRSPTSSDERVNTSGPDFKLVDPPHVHHSRFFFDDGDITFIVEGVLHRVHRYFFYRDSSEFRRRLSRLATSSPAIIPLEDVKSVDFDAFLSVLYPLNFNALEEHSFEEWSSILDLSTRWGFTSIRDLAIRCVEPPCPLHRLILARKYSIEQWVLPSLLELCERPQPLSPDEARLMDLEDVVLVGFVRQSVRSPTRIVGGTAIRDRIQAWTSGGPFNPVLEPPATCPTESQSQTPPSDSLPEQQSTGLTLVVPFNPVLKPPATCPTESQSQPPSDSLPEQQSTGLTRVVSFNPVLEPSATCPTEPQSQPPPSDSLPEQQSTGLTPVVSQISFQENNIESDTTSPVASVRKKRCKKRGKKVRAADHVDRGGLPEVLAEAEVYEQV
ncbi:hypothetical protein BC826DRAFT_968513 [Russula brevipes]|nr:hypothetical protein BC826DRAFT_968513 [Russula brevipes]